jgi:hypothetical protein
MTTDPTIDAARQRLQDLRAQHELEVRSGVIGHGGGNRRPGAAKSERAARNRRRRRLVRRQLAG